MPVGSCCALLLLPCISLSPSLSSPPLSSRRLLSFFLQRSAPTSQREPLYPSTPHTHQHANPPTIQPHHTPTPTPHPPQIDCVENRDLCAAQVVRAFPTLRLFKGGKALSPDYREDRTVEALTVCAHHAVSLSLSLLPPSLFYPPTHPHNTPTHTSSSPPPPPPTTPKTNAPPP